MFTLLKKSDADAVRQVVTGHRDQFNTLVERYLPSVYAVAYAQLHNHADAEDVAQETFLAAFTTLHTLREPKKFEGWVVCMARRIAIKIREKRRRADAALPEGGRELAIIPDAARDELRQLLRDEIERLDVDSREIILLHYFTGKSTGGIAAALDIGHEAAKKRLQRARKTLSDNFIGLVTGETKPETDFQTQRGRIAGLVAVAAGQGFRAHAGTGQATHMPAGLAKTAAIALAALMLLGAGAYYLRNTSAPEAPVETAPTLVSRRVPASSPVRQPNMSPRPMAAEPPVPDRRGAGYETAVHGGAVSRASLTGLWRMCDSEGMMRNTGSAGDLMYIEASEAPLAIYLPDGVGPGKRIAAGTISGKEILVVTDDPDEMELQGTLLGPDTLVLAGEVPMDNAAVPIEMTFTRLDVRDLAEVEIQERRKAEVQTLAKAIQTYARDHDDYYPEALADLGPSYVDTPELARSSATRRIVYAPNGMDVSPERNPYPDAASQQERLLLQEADLLNNWPTFPSTPPVLAIRYAAPEMTLVCENAQRPSVRRTDTNTRLVCQTRPGFSDAMNAGHAASCTNNMTQLGIVLRVFAESDPEGCYPGGWASTFPDFMTDTMILTCPSLGEFDEMERTISYTLLFPGTDIATRAEFARSLGFNGDGVSPPEDKIPIAVEIHECAANGGSHVLFADGHVERLAPEAWDSRVAPFADCANAYYASM